MTFSARPPILVIGLGNPILGDDGIGWRVVQEVQAGLEKETKLEPLAVEFDFLSLGGLSLMERLVGYQQALLIDAISTGTVPPGSILEFDLQDLPSSASGHLASSHDTSLKTAIEMGRALKAQLPEQILIIAIEIKISYDFNESLSPPVAAAIMPAVRLAFKKIALMMVK